MKRVQINGSRFYRIAGQKNLMPSVTTVLSVIGKKFLSRWETNLALGKIRSRVEERIQEGNVDRVTAAEMDAWIQEAIAEPAVHLEAASGFGTEAHQIFEDLLGGKEDSVIVPPELETVVANFVAWRDSISFRVIENEMMVYSKEFQYAGAVDAVVESEGKTIIMDWKTSNRIQNEYALQVSAYAKAYEEMTGDKVHEAWIVRFDKHTRKMPQIKVVYDIEESFDTFLCAKRLWAFCNAPMGKKRRQ